MTNKIIIDAWNVCWKIPDIAQIITEDLALARQKFNILIKNYFTNKSTIYKIIYDGQPGIINSYDNDKIQFSKNPQSADQKIITFLKVQKKPDLWTIISSDRELAGRAKNLGVNAISSEDFISKLIKKKINYKDSPQKSNPNLSRDEINDWLKIFNNQK